ncbi:LysR family transcriptional regulator [Chitinilyticum aquatile]|uniref:LysR family transcriptional regulator n=1 Tax=Chitinilyticum aquatile TaxID=362520 RepID=UPI00040444E1|nr:LysR family transcriptional regulator [Chitinilyticum aquatile]
MDTIELHQHAQQLQWAMSFVNVIEHGSFTAAAGALGVSKALLSKQLRQLESALGTQLLFRSTRRLNLTPAGSLYLSHCHDWLARVRAASSAVAELRAEVSGHLRITVPTSFGGVFMAQALLAFRERYPLVTVDVDLSTTARDLEAEGFDLAIRANLAPPGHLVCRPLAEIHDWLVASPDWLQNHAAITQPETLAELPCIANSRFSQAQDWTFSHAGELSSVRIPSPIRCNDYYLIRNLALNGGGIARLPAYLVGQDVADGRLQRLLPDYTLQGMQLYLVYPQQLPQPARLQALVEFLLGWFAAPEQARLLGKKG